MSDVSYANTLGHSVKRLYRLMELRFNEFLRPYGIARGQWYALYRIQRAGTITQRELQSILQVESATMTTIVDSLERKGWVCRTPSAADRRVNELRLTPQGRTRWQELPDPLTAIQRRMLEGLSGREEEIARRILDKAIRNLELDQP